MKRTFGGKQSGVSRSGDWVGSTPEREGEGAAMRQKKRTTEEKNEWTGEE